MGEKYESEIVTDLIAELCEKYNIKKEEKTE